MKPETRLNKIMQIEDLSIRKSECELFCMRALPHSELWEKAHAEWERLNADGVVSAVMRYLQRKEVRR